MLGFRQEIQAMIDAEMKKKNAGAFYNPHLEDINPEHLGGLEERAYRELTSGTLTEKTASELETAAWSHYNPRYSSGAPERQSIREFWGYVKNEVIKNLALEKVRERHA